MLRKCLEIVLIYTARGWNALDCKYILFLILFIAHVTVILCGRQPDGMIVGRLFV